MTLTATPPQQAPPAQRWTISSSQTSVERFRKTITYVLLIAGTAVFVVPFLWMLTTSLKTAQEVLAYPPKALPATPHFDNYPAAWTSLPFTTFLINSIIITGLSVIGNLVSCVLPAYAFARLRARARGPLFALMVATMAIPAEVTLVPTFIMFSKLNLVNTYWPLFLPAWFGYAFFIFLLRQFFLTIPQELTDAASIDGAGHLRTLWSIFLPMSKPAIAAVAIFSFVGNWNNFLTPLIYLRTQNNFTLALGLSLFKGQYETQYNQMMAVGIISLLPILIVFFLAQRTFVEGVRLSGLGGR
ncbi:carbohydrate ABC transporter permease [Kribbella sp. NPDC000426]|uniref:carbohydrate ABC transporter permease n=1 Tax=Kribbella sp. NPDC000426 TaxID=3154255 RepID=UPI003317FA63